MNALEQFHQTMRHNVELVKQFNKFADQKDVVIYNHATRVEHEAGYIMIRYRTIDSVFCYSEKMPDDDRVYDPHFLAALTSGRALPNYCVSTTDPLTEEQARRWREAFESAKEIKPPLAEAA